MGYVMRRLSSGTVPLSLLLGLGASLVACSVPEEDIPAAVEDSRILLADEEPEELQGVALDDDGNIVTDDLEIVSDGEFTEDAAAGASAADASGQAMTIHFDYDSTDVKSRFMDVIQRAVAHLKDNPAGRLRLEGHTDERGTRAYNLALGERRAQSVRDMILDRGALAEQVDWVSYGEELPLATGQGEEVWRQNRRVEIILEE